MRQKSSRRRFLQTTAVAGIGFWVAGGVRAAESKVPSERVRFACIGISGKGQSDSADAAQKGDVVAVCDVDKGTLARADAAFPSAKKFTDFRKLLDEMKDQIDAVTVSTPDHIHAQAAVKAMRMGKHCFCQKPLTHAIYEARRMGEIAREMKLATQMGNQGTAGSGLRKAAALIKAGALGTVTEVHVWTNRPIWPQGGARPETKPVPKSLEWDLWLGPAPERPYADGYHPFKWRGYWDFGTGALGDMACHTVNMPFMGLDLRNPTSVQAETSGHNKDTYPNWSKIAFEFPANEHRPAVKFFWYDGGKKVSLELIEDLLEVNQKSGKKQIPGSGALVVGDKGKLFSPDDYGGSYKVTKGVDADMKVDFRPSPRGGHFQEWVDAIKGGPQSVSNFPDYAGPLTETILLGNLAVAAAAAGQGDKVEWDPINLKPKNLPELEAIVKPAYRAGYGI
jgi:predicted dehydrogenase